MNHEFAVLAAWLHDVGKFAQRAEAPASRRLEQEYCPGGKTHQHVLYTDFFIENVLRLPPDLEARRSSLARLASAHHRPNEASREEIALQRADCLSSGGDRMEGQAGGNYKTARLESIFSEVRLGGKRLPEDEPRLRYRLRPLDAGDDALFPVREAGNADSYRDLFKAFCKALEDLPLNMGMRHYLNSLATVLERFTWCIPSSTYQTRADISLYDHAATTAAITQALLACPQGREAFLLFAGDLSGIQNFIFGVEEHADKGASKLLRARSFLLQALTRSVWLTLLDRLDLSGAAKIMDAGGRFVLLLPDTEAIRQEIETLQNEVEQWLLDTFQGMIRMTFASLPLEPESLRRERFTDCFEHLNDLLEQAKLRPFARAFRRHVSPVLPIDHENYRQFGECALCHARPASARQDDDDDDTPVCDLCRPLIRQVGRRLPRARFLILDRRHGGLPLFGDLFARLEEDDPDPATAVNALDIVSMRDRRAFSAVPVAGFIPMVREEDLRRWREEGRLSEQGGDPVLAGEPCPSDKPKTFAVLAEESRIAPQSEGEKWRSVACLAACKADVDNLGLLFGMGFGVGKDSCFSISRFAMLSRMMNHFFSAHLMRVIERDFPNMYVIFAGGDDLFVLGPWAETVRFAKRLHEDFRAFSGGNPAVTLSAGLPVLKPRLPMRALREAAEAALDAAKDHPGKNAVTLFGVTTAWQRFDGLIRQGEWLEGLCLSGSVTQGLVRRLLGYARDCHNFNRGEIRKGLYLSHMAYDMARNCDEKRMSPEDLKALKTLGQDRQLFPLAEMSCTWALYRTRICG